MVEAEKTYPCMEVTQVKVYPFRECASIGSLLGLANIVLNDQFLVRGLRIMDGENGIYVGYPNYPFYKGEAIHTICSPATRALREEIENKVIKKYYEEIKG